jgi:predicted ATP-dependent serine protease
LECPLPNDIAFIGEIDLGGNLRVVSALPTCPHTVHIQLLCLPNDIAFIGEIDLDGITNVCYLTLFVVISLLPKVPRMDKRIMAVAQLGYKKCVVPKAAENLIAALDIEMAILGCDNLKDMIYTVFNQNLESKGL